MSSPGSAVGRRPAATGRKRWVWAIGLAGVLLMGWLGWSWWRGRSASAGQRLEAAVSRGDIRRTVSATGTLKALITVQVGSQVTGVIQSLGADFNSVVRAGQVVARIDPSSFAARARIKSAEASLLNQRANLQAAVANLEGARAAGVQADAQLRRSRELFDRGILPSSDLESAESTAIQARSRVTALEAAIEQGTAQVESAEAGLEQARAEVRQSEAALSVARVNLDHTVITSPIDGVVISRSVDVGQTVAASLQAPTLFVIANDLRKMNVIAAIDEADIGSIGPETRVSFSVDAFPGQTFRGRIAQVRLEPQTLQNVVTYSVIIDVENADLTLRPGMTATVSLVVAEARGVLRVPNAALRYWPEGVPREKMGELLGERPPASGPTGLQRAEGREGRRKDRDASRAETDAGAGKPAAEGPSRASGELALPPPPPAEPKARIVWVARKDGEPEPRRVLVTITDGSQSAVVGGQLAEGDKVLTGAAVANARAGANGRTQNPLAPQMGGPRR